jgi:Flp pilus assembly protein TadG
VTGAEHSGFSFPLRDRFRDERGLVGKMMVTLLLIIILVGVVAVETGSIVFAKLSLENTASTAAADGERDLLSSHSANSACQSAAQSMIEHDKDARFVQCVADPRTNQIYVKIRKEAPTLIVQRVGFLRKLGIVKAEAETGPGPD